MHLETRPREIRLLQAAASMGQSRLMHSYELEFGKSRHETAQILLTYEDIHNRTRYLNIRNTIFALWDHGAVPIVNENDTVSYAEIRFGDNDLLSAHLAIMVDADLLLVLTSADGVYDRDPSEKGARIVREIPRIGDDVKKWARGRTSNFSTGGMESKLEAAGLATQRGIPVVIASGARLKLKGILDGEEIGTYCVPRRPRIRGRKKWIALGPRIEGAVVVDKGGERAIVAQNKSLLPAGIRRVEGRFEIGANVAILNEEGAEIARGLVNFSSRELDAIKGLNSKKIPEVLGVDVYFEEAVHRDNLVITA
jgi:glutamate 5-kinase